MLDKYISQLIQKFASRTVTEHLLNGNMDAAIVSKESFNLDENRVRGAFASYYVKNNMSGDAKVLEDELFELVRDKKLKPWAIDRFRPGIQIKPIFNIDIDIEFF